MTLKQERMADRIREIISTLLLLEVTDPALQGVTVVEVVLDRELEYADVYVNALGDDSRQGEVMKGLNRANGFIRREVGKRIQIRRTPVLRFHWDVTLTRGEAMEQALDRVKASDAARAKTDSQSDPQSNSESPTEVAE
jgi:ribosome-binding factor A